MPDEFRTGPDAAIRYGMINHHREDQQSSTFARRTALTEADLRAAGIDIPVPATATAKVSHRR